MNLPRDDGAADALELPTAEMVAAYLRRHPNFFESYPEVLRDIEITHAAGDAVSLLERQVTGLRAENDRLKVRFDALVSLAKSNEDLVKRIHQLALALMGAAGPEAIFETLKGRLAEEFSADRVGTLIFANAAAVGAPDLPEFAGRDDDRCVHFEDMFAGQTPRCGQLTQDQCMAVFGDVSALSGSAVMLPLAGSGWNGLVVVSSNDDARFTEAMGTDFLAYLADIVSLVVDPWVARDRAG